MPRKKDDNRVRLVQAAAKLTYRHGFRQTSLADIAKDARVPLGNVYYYFKTKDEIAEAIVGRRLAEVQMLLRELEKAQSAKDRLCGFVRMTLNNRETLARGGCPIGTLCSELHKDAGAVAKNATVLFAEILNWMETQFLALGAKDAARGLAVHLLSALQGVAVLALNFHDPGLVEMEAQRLQMWISALEINNNAGEQK